jgi:hypothetical protein
MKLWTTLTGDVACKAIRGIGFEFSPRELRLQLRGDCWAVWIPGGYMAWFPVNDQGLERLNVERKVLGLLHRRCRFEVPRICFESASGFDVRIVVPGRHDPLRWYNRALSNDFIARRIGVDLGEILAEQHTAISKVDVEGWIPERALWPGPAALMRDKLRYVIENAELFEQLTRAYQCYENTIVSHDDCVLTHTDLGFHNFSIFESTGCISGVFDYKAAAWADRHHDFRGLTDVEETWSPPLQLTN